MKRCYKCGETKSSDAFAKNRSKKDGLQNYCKPCSRLYARDTKRNTIYFRKWRYGITKDEYDALASAQGGRCAICVREPEVLVVDHDHETGRIRGLLCNNCNTAIGLLGDDPTVIRLAVAYLSRSALDSALD